MSAECDIRRMDEKIREIRKAAEELKEIGGNIEAVNRNLVRLLASTRMLELNISDAASLVWGSKKQATGTAIS